MALYLDIDLDYFVKPVIHKAVIGQRPSSIAECFVSDINPLFDILTDRGITFGPKQYLFTNHMQSHLFWWVNKTLNNIVIHIDAHSDLYRHRKRSLQGLPQLADDNFLWHAVRDELINEIFWVFPEGQYDFNQDPRKLALNFFHQEQFCEAYYQENRLTIMLECLLPSGREKTIPYHLLTMDNLPDFNQETQITTVASSPEFLPAEADILINQVGQKLNFDTSRITKILTEHQKLLQK